MYYTISQTAKKTNLTPFTLRYYDKEGLLSPARTEKGIRYFTDDDLARIDVVRCLKNAGMTIRDIKYFLTLCSLGENTIPEQLALFLRYRAKLSQDIQVLQQHLTQIEEKITWLQDYQATHPSR